MAESRRRKADAPVALEALPGAATYTALGIPLDLLVRSNSTPLRLLTYSLKLHSKSKVLQIAKDLGVQSLPKASMQAAVGWALTQGRYPDIYDITRATGRWYWCARSTGRGRPYKYE